LLGALLAQLVFLAGSGGQALIARKVLPAIAINALTSTFSGAPCSRLKMAGLRFQSSIGDSVACSGDSAAVQIFVQILATGSPPSVRPTRSHHMTEMPASFDEFENNLHKRDVSGSELIVRQLRARIVTWVGALLDRGPRK